MHQYQLVDSQLWQCRADAIPGDYFCHNVVACNLELDHLESFAFALLGFASDLGVERNHGRVGAKQSPNIIRQFMSRLAIPYLKSCYDCGNIVVDNSGSLLAGQTMLASSVSSLIRAGITPLVLGGGHETAYGHYMGIMDAVPGDIAILNFDAHFDLRPVATDNEGNSGTPFRQIYNQCQQQQRNFDYYCVGIQPRSNTQALYQFAAETNTHFIEAREVIKNPQTVIDLVNQILNKHQQIYVTICLDVFHASYAPGVSAPQPLGINPQVVIDALQILAASKKVLSLDVVELNPLFDVDNRTARLAANLLAEFYYPDSLLN